MVDKSIGLFINCYLATCDQDDQERHAREKQDMIEKKKRQLNRTQIPDDKAVIEAELKILKAEKDK